MDNAQYRWNKYWNSRPKTHEGKVPLNKEIIIGIIFLLQLTPVISILLFQTVGLIGSCTNLKGLMYFLWDKKHDVHRFTLNIHRLKIMIVESFPENIPAAHVCYC